MTRTALVAAALVLAGIGWAAGTGSGATNQERPLLGVTGTSPLEIRGTGFVPGERVQVLLAVGGRQLWRSAVASSAGVFRVSFRASLGRCGRFTVQAFGSRGSRARVLQRRLLPDCLSPTGIGSNA